MVERFLEVHPLAVTFGGLYEGMMQKQAPQPHHLAIIVYAYHYFQLPVVQVGTDCLVLAPHPPIVVEMRRNLRVLRHGFR